MLVPLRTVIKVLKGDSARIKQVLSLFSCDMDADIDDFFHNKAVEFENISKARTYIVFNDDKLERGELEILAYFSLSLKVLILPEGLSNRKRKAYDGYRGVIHGNPIREIPCYLIGQLAKNSAVKQNEYSGKDLLNDAMSLICEAADLIGGRYALIECHPHQKLLNFYEKNGFQQFNTVSINESEKMLQLLREI